MTGRWKFSWLVLVTGLWQSFTVASFGQAAPPPPPARAEIEAVLAQATHRANQVATPGASAAQTLHVVLLADKKDHGPEQHDYPRWQERWALLLGGKAVSGASQVNLFGPPISDERASAGAAHVAVMCAQGWPTESQLAQADVIVVFCYVAWNDLHKQQLKHYLDHGGGLVLIHAATWTMPGPDPQVATLVGVGGFLHYRHGPVQLRITDSEHPVCRGLPRTLAFFDETYWPPTPPLGTESITVLAVSEDDNGAGPAARAPQPIFWTYQRGPGRVFGCVLGHYTWTFDDPWFRLLLLRGIAWAGGQPADRLDALALRGARVAGK
jgi:type 1 glutamine amidotransferase